MGAALLGAPLLSATAGASTVGAIGAGGVFSASVAASTIGSMALKFVGSSLLSGLLTGASAFGQVQAGNAQAQLMNLQAQQSTLNARNETLKGRATALQIRKDLDRKLASQNATFSARGMLAGEGSAAAAEAASRNNASDDINVALFGSEMASESDKLQAAQFRAEGKAAKTAGRIEAVNTIANSRALRNMSSSLLEI